ncbi:hypothetical protein BC826DRAFT_165753 [Russula brevipes]|nr:hypothetical protein BC826DRAFT_165753 [Russula brevipes]
MGRDTHQHHHHFQGRSQLCAVMSRRKGPIPPHILSRYSNWHMQGDTICDPIASKDRGRSNGALRRRLGSSVSQVQPVPDCGLNKAWDETRNTIQSGRRWK